jgi:hypothetical protein
MPFTLAEIMRMGFPNKIIV